MSTEQLVIQHADQVEAMAGTGAIFALRLEACEPEQRIWLLEHHGRVIRELRRRGHNVRANVIVDENDHENATIRVVNPAGWSVPLEH